MEKDCPMIPPVDDRKVYGNNDTSPAAYSTMEDS
jgi:hypothetical protein